MSEPFHHHDWSISEDTSHLLCSHCDEVRNLLPAPAIHPRAKTFTRAELEELGNQIAALGEAINNGWYASEISSVASYEECEALATLQSELRLSIASTLGLPYLGSDPEEDGELHPNSENTDV